MNFNGRLVWFVTISSLLCVNAANLTVIPSSIAPELTKLCKEAENPGLCVQIILRSVHGSLDPYNILVTEIGSISRYTMRALRIMVSLMAKPNSPKSLSDSLSYCKEEYGNILDSVQNALRALATEATYVARSSLGAIISYQQTCVDDFIESGAVLPFSRESKQIFQLAGNCLDVMAAVLM